MFVGLGALMPFARATISDCVSAPPRSITSSRSGGIREGLFCQAETTSSWRD